MMRYITVLLALLVLVSVQSADAVTVNFNQTQRMLAHDTFAYYDFPTGTWGTEHFILISVGSGTVMRPFTFWNLGVLPSNAVITVANLSLFAKDGPDEARRYLAYNTTPTWNESKLNWNNMPANDTLQDNVSIPGSGAGANERHYFDVTDAALYAWNAGNRNMSIVLIDNNESYGGASFGTEYRTRDDFSYPARMPQLILTYTDSVKPTINLSSPANVTHTASTANINVTTDEMINTWLYEFDANGTNISMEVRDLWLGVIEARYTNITSRKINTPDGSHSVRVWAKDFAGNWNTSIVYFKTDTTAPYYNGIVNPSIDVSSEESISFRIDVYDTTSDVVNVTVDIFGSNHTMTQTSANVFKANVTTPSVSSNTNYTYRYYMNDTWGFYNSSGQYSLVVGAGGTSGGETPGPEPEPKPRPGPIDDQCGGFTIAFGSKSIEVSSSAGTKAPPVTLVIYNGEKTQVYGQYFETELAPYCVITQWPPDNVLPNSQFSYKFECIIPDEVVRGNLIISTDTGCKEAVRVTLLPTLDIVGQFGDFFRLIGSGDLDGFTITYHGTPLAVILCIIFAVVAVLLKVLML